MTLETQIERAEQMARLCKESQSGDEDTWEAIAETLKKHKRAAEIVQDLEQDFRSMANMSIGMRTLKAAAIATAKWHIFLEFGRIFLKMQK